MKSFARVAVFPVVTLLSIGVANAQPKPAVLSALPPQNFAFCLNTDATVVISDTVATEVGVVITNVGNGLTNTSGSVVVAANNFYGKGAGSEWRSAMGQFSLAGGNCYNIASMNKTTSPSGTAWTCALTSGAASGAGATITGVISTQTQVTPIASGYVMAGVSATLNNAPSVNCPY
ncbi:hypothetical protein JHL17_05740 [Azospirillum sp. YIM B02556]|uniref:Uncharacterized protein n=1 Tax=Azospirillum endophyticum TaxID=2800326 RepID=A0ABS1F0F9_9PROT|nr:hypothetical protein [Azospirillum endophyticum]MBK1836909.1 hypothetical protein [Azospirillum endophyticum]